MVNICVGTAQFGMHYGIANKTGIPNLSNVKKIINKSLQNEIFYFDTAQSYEKSELILGHAFKSLKDKKNIKVITKLSPDFFFTTFQEIINSSVESIEKLQIDFLYGLLAHRISQIKSKKFLKAMRQLKREKLIKKFGVSVYSPKEAINILENLEIDILQIPVNILDNRWIESGVIHLAEKKKVKLFFRSIFLQGLIFLRSEEISDLNMDWANSYLKEFRKLISNYSYSVKELSFGILNKLTKNNILIIGIDNINQLQENISICKNVNFSDSFCKKWWDELPSFPEKLLNPSFWNVK